MFQLISGPLKSIYIYISKKSQDSEIRDDLTIEGTE